MQGERYTLYLATKKNSLLYVLSSPTQLTFYIQPKTISLLQRTKTHIELCTFHKSGNFAADYQTITQSCYQNNLINHKSYSTMKQGIHPENYRPVVFKDMSNGDMFLSRSTCKTTDTVEFEGETYPVVKLEISSTSHPFYTGKSKLVDTAGRVDKFMSRYGKSRK